MFIRNELTLKLAYTPEYIRKEEVSSKSVQNHGNGESNADKTDSFILDKSINTSLESEINYKVINDNEKQKIKYPFICDICGNSFEDKLSVKRHILNVHKIKTKDKTKIIDESERKVSGKVVSEKDPQTLQKAFKRKLKFKNKNDTNKNETCNQTLLSENLGLKKSLKKRLKKRPDEPDPIQTETGYACPLCDKQFTFRKYVPYHIRRVHLKILYPHKLSKR